jgi:translation initiation factor IF-2
LTSGSIVIGFNVRADASAKRICQNEDIDLRYYSVIYEAIEEIKSALSGLLSPEKREKIIGMAEVKEVFRSSKFGAAAGCIVTEGVLSRRGRIRVLRDNIVVYDGELESLRRFKDDVSEVRSGTDCGVAVKGYNDVRVKDKIEAYEVTEIMRTL